MSEKLNMQELISLLAEKSGINKKDAEIFLREYFNQITEALLEDKIAKVKKIGTFKLSLVLDRESVDVNNGTRVLIPAHNKVSYTPDSQLAKKINEPFALFEPVEVEENASDNEVKPYPETEEEEFIVARSEEDHIKINDIAGEAQETIVEIEEQEIVEEQTPEIVSETGETQNKSQFDNTPIFKDPGRRTSYKWFWTIPVLIVFSLIGLFLLCIEKDTNNWTDLFFTEGPKTDLISLPKENNYISGSTLSRKEILTETTITDSSFPSRKDTVIPKAAITEEIPSSSILSSPPRFSRHPVWYRVR
ncbi:MAG: HU family DNA-binding protein [Bacteroidales bacterium]|nr:HU family DNA-binding protein [Bacteroidales bacterium]